MKTTAPSPTAATGHPAPTLQLPIAGLLAGQRGSAGTVVTASPSTGQKLADMPQASVEDVDQIFLTAARAQKHWAATDPVRRVEPFPPSSDVVVLATDPAVHRAVEHVVAQGNSRVSRVEQIKRFHILPTVWSPGGDELTATMKLRRRVVEAKYAADIDRLYD